MTRRHRRRRRRTRLGVATLLAAALAVGGVVALTHVRATDRLAARERAAAGRYDAARAAQVTRAATRTGAAEPTGAAPSSGAAVDHRVTIAATPSTTTWVSTTVHLTYDGLDRAYVVYRPVGVSDRRLPVLVMLSGSGKTATGEAARADFRRVASPAVLVYPEDTDLDGLRNWDAGTCCGLAASRKIDDVGFVAAVIARVRRLPDAAPGPVDLAGYSNGAKLALLVACDDPGLVAGVATYGAVPAADCPHRPAVSLLEMAGADDPELTIGPGGTPVVDSGYTEERVTTVVTTELRADGCTSTTDTARAGRVTETLWPSCRDGRRVGLVVYAGQAHTWPQTDGATPSAQQVMWDWFVALGTVAA